MDLSEFFAETSTNSAGSWADDEMPVVLPGGTFQEPLSGGAASSATSWGPSGNSSFGQYERSESRYPPREPVPIPDEPPFTARLLNLDWEATEDKIKGLFETPDYKVVSVRVPRDMANGRIRGFAFVEFEDRASLERALKLEGTSLLSRTLRVVVAEPQNRPDDRTEGDWRSGRSGPLPPLERGGDRRGPRREFDDSHDYDKWERRGPLPPLEHRGERRGPPRERREFDDGHDYNNWERKGPLPPLEDRPPRRGSSRFGGADDQHDYDNWERKGPLPPRRERKTSAPDVADTVDDWRARRQGSASGRGGQRATSSGSTDSSAPHPRKKLELKPRTIGAHEAVPAPASEHARSSLFGAAKPVDTQRKFIEVEERQRKIEEERREHRYEEQQKKEEVKTASVRKRFELLSTEDDEEGDAVAESSGEQVGKPVEKLTAAEQLFNREASLEELETGNWNVVKRSARK